MKIPFVSFLPMEKELNSELRAAFDRVFSRSWYIEGEEDEAFEKVRENYEAGEIKFDPADNFDEYEIYPAK